MSGYPCAMDTKQHQTFSDSEYQFAVAYVSYTIEKLTHTIMGALKAGYSPSQPRAPRGIPTGGQWVRMDGMPEYGFEADPRYPPENDPKPPT